MRRLTATLLLAASCAAACGSGSTVKATSGATTSPSVTTSSSTTTSTSTTVSATTSATTSTTMTTDPHPHFDSPEAAMRYLAAAWNANDLVALRHVTDPGARQQLDDMHTEAIDLRLDRCEARQGLGDYTCYFDHEYPSSYPVENRRADGGQAVFLVGPADTPGWYMTVFESCG